jgi:hypothetical protein
MLQSVISLVTTFATYDKTSNHRISDIVLNKYIELAGSSGGAVG